MVGVGSVSEMAAARMIEFRFSEFSDGWMEEWMDTRMDRRLLRALWC